MSLTTEDLQAISHLLDSKLQTVQSDINNIKSEMSDMHSNMNNMNSVMKLKGCILS